ncbi:uncharacterized protein LOC114748944, partial [Neltuma alba]|uniref:uncharacterized protein LOC114748944 n=1 Tax=Neltuma alba TaxID=207710 RepID=UPI0010A45BA1
MAARVLMIMLLSLTAAFAEPLSRRRAMQVIQEVKQKGPYFGIIAAYPPEEIAFFASKAFEPDPNHPFVELSAERSSGTTQMIDVLDVVWDTAFWNAGSANDSISFGDVTIPKQFVHTGLWDWL